MWYLISSIDSGVKYCLLVGQAITVGRKGTDVSIPSDPTVSRKHAVIQVQHNEANLAFPKRPPEVTLKDESRYGTWVNGKELPSKGSTSLHNGDQIRFGSPQSTFLCVHEPFVVSTSCLDTAGKRSVRGCVLKLGGHVVREWQRECSLLIMSSISVTVKVVSALVALRPIVTPAYLTALQEALKANTKIPEPSEYCPELSDPHLNPNDVSFDPNPSRQTLFSGKTVIFLTSTQFKKLSLTIELSGGLPLLQDDDNDDDDLLVDDDTIVMNSDIHDPSGTEKWKQWVLKVQSLLKSHRKRMIPDSEIGYAVVFCSIEKHCNPKHNPVDEIKLELPSQSLSEQPFSIPQHILVPNTELSQSTSHSSRALGQSRESHQKRETAVDKNENESDFQPPQSIRRKRARAPDGESPSHPSKSSRKENGESRVMIKLEKLSQDEAVTIETSSSKGKRSTLSKDKEVKTQVTDESSSDEVPFMPKSRHRRPDNVLVQDTEMDTSIMASPRHKTVDDQVRVSDSDHETKIVSPDRGKNKAVSHKRAEDKMMLSPRAKESSNNQSEPKKSPGSSNKDDDDDDDGFKEIKREALDDDWPDEIPMQSERKTTSKSLHQKRGQQNSETTSIRPNSDIKMSPDQIRSPRISDSEEEQQQQHVRNHDNDDIPSGYLSTQLPLKGQVRPTEEFIKEETTVQIAVEFKSLVVRRPRAKVTVSIHSTGQDGYVMWKGKKVRNFKKFKKSDHVGSGMLPRIIGGGDLEAHVNNPRAELDQWYNESMKADTQRNEEDIMASQLFNFDKKSKPTKIKGRRSR